MNAPASSGTLRKKIFTSAKLSAVQFGSNIGLRLISTVVLTRLLAPEVYGVFAVVLLYRQLLEMLSDIGIRDVILTKEGDLDAPFLSTCWTVSILRGALIFLVSGLIALVIFWLQRQGVFSAESSYVDPVLPLAIFVLGGAGFITGVASINRYVYEKNMLFGRVTLGTFLANVVSLIVTIALAYAFHSIWALVAGAYAHAFFLTVFSFLAFPGAKLRLALERSSLGVIIDRGKWIMGSSTLTVLSESADRFIFGFVMSSSMFGFYFIARQIFDLGVSFLTSVNAQMGMQVFTELLKKPAVEFRARYYKYRIFFDTLAGLGAGGLFVVMPLAVDLIFDDRYAGVASIAQILIIGWIFLGPAVLRHAFMAERKFRELTLLGLMGTFVTWFGLILAVLLDSITTALVVFALKSAPEVIVMSWLGFRKGWVQPSREAIVVLLFGVGGALGWIALQIWAAIF